MKTFIRFSILLLLLLTAVSVTAKSKHSPKTVIIIRHADKFSQLKEPGPALSPKGLTRSMAFALFYINNLCEKYEYPDFIITTNPYDRDKKYKAARSFRHLQTVAPLVSWLYYFRQKETSEYLVQIPYNAEDYDELVADLFSKKRYDGKNVLICWSHSKILDLVKILLEGLTVSDNSQQLPSKWNGDDYSTVLIFEFLKDKEVKITIKNVNDVYPVTDNEYQQFTIIHDYYRLFNENK